MRLHRMVMIHVMLDREALEPLLAELRGAGVTGYTIVPAEGLGKHHGPRLAQAGQPLPNVVVESITTEDVAEQFVERLRETHLLARALTLALLDVRVLRHEKFL